VHNARVVSPCTVPIKPCGYAIWVADLGGIEITIQILNPVGITRVGKAMRWRWGCILRVTHLDPLDARPGWGRRLLP